MRLTQIDKRKLTSSRPKPVRRAFKRKRPLRGGLDDERLVHASTSEWKEYEYTRDQALQKRLDEQFVNLLNRHKEHFINVFNVNRLLTPFHLQKRCEGIFLNKLIFGKSDLPGPNRYKDPVGTNRVLHQLSRVKYDASCTCLGSRTRAAREKLASLMPEVEVYFRMVGSNAESLPVDATGEFQLEYTLRIRHANKDTTLISDSRYQTVRIKWEDPAWWEVTKIELFDHNKGPDADPLIELEGFETSWPCNIAMWLDDTTGKVDGEYCLNLNCWKQADRKICGKPARPIVFRIFIRWTPQHVPAQV